ncbi:hypothetical protein N8152_03110 [bacterium]|nr:hypothetical protein [bacterium]
MFGDDEYLLCGAAEGVRCGHRKFKETCEICIAKSRCVHGKAPSRCLVCGGGGMCTHGRQRSQCVECGGNGICKHKRIKSRCKDCGGSGVCTHGRRKYRCRFCKEEKMDAEHEEGPFKLREHFLGVNVREGDVNAATRQDFEPNPAEKDSDSGRDSGDVDVPDEKSGEGGDSRDHSVPSDEQRPAKKGKAA